MAQAAVVQGRSLDPLRWFPQLTLLLFLTPIAAGLLGTWLPAFGYLPAVGGTELTFDPWRQLLAYPGLATSVRLSLVSGFIATAFSLGLVIAFFACCSGSRVFSYVRRLLAPILAVPHLAIAIGFAFLIAPSGWILRFISPWVTGWQLPPDLPLVQDPYGLALALGLVLKETPFLFLMTLGALNQIGTDKRLAVAASLGYGPVYAWVKTVLPAVYPRIRLPVYAVLAFSLSVVDMAIILAPATPPPLAVLVLRWFNDPDLSMRFLAAACACLQLGLVVVAILCWYGIERLVSRLGRRWLVSGRRGGDGHWGQYVFGSAMALCQGLAVLSLLGMAVWSVSWRWRFPDALPIHWTASNWARQFSDGLGWATWTTAVIALASSFIALVLVIGCLENETRYGVKQSDRSLWLLYTPLLVPQVAFLFGAQVLAVWTGVDGTWVAMVWAHLLFVLPYVFLALAEPYRTLDDRYLRTALCLGATPSRAFWRVKLPMLLRPVLFALAVGFAVSVSQYLPTIFAGSGRFMTLTTEALSLASGADRRVVGVYAIMQAALPLLAFAMALILPAWIFRYRRGMRVF